MKESLAQIHDETKERFRLQGGRLKTQSKIQSCLEVGMGHKALFELFDRRLQKLVGNGIPETLALDFTKLPIFYPHLETLVLLGLRPVRVEQLFG
eukprot:5410925-Karenia_brevis.AAC.1